MPGSPFGGLAPEGLSGGSRTSRELATWRPSMGSPDRIINGVKDLVDARGRDVIMNDGGAANAVHIHRNSIVGARYILNARPNWRILGGDESWSKEFAQTVEDRFKLFAESLAYWIDASRSTTFTGLLRLGVGGFLLTGEVLGTAEWIKEASRPYKTAIQMVSPVRLSNPDGMADTPTLRKGVEKDSRGAPQAYHFRVGHPGDFMFPYNSEFRWKRVPVRTPWGRLQVLHLTDPLEPAQTRGISDMVAILKDLKMMKQFQDVTLQNAVVNATYAAAIESELPSEVIAAAMGGGSDGYNAAIGQYLSALEGYIGDAQNLRMDGVKIPHLFPGTKLNLQPAGTPGGVGTDFEAALFRHMAAGLGVSYEELTKDYSKLSYSGGRLSLVGTERFMAARKVLVADGMANAIYALWLEEELNLGNVPPLPGMNKRSMLKMFYEDPILKEALCVAVWIGASAGQVDELKETQAAGMRMSMGLSTQEAECARLGKDYQEVNAQLEREKDEAIERGLIFNLSAQKTLTAPQDEVANDQAGSGGA